MFVNREEFIKELILREYIRNNASENLDKLIGYFLINNNNGGRYDS